MSGLASGSRDVTAVLCENRPGFFVPSLRYRELSAAWSNVESLELEISLQDKQIEELGLALHERTRAATVAATRADLLERTLEKSLDRTTKAEQRAAQAVEDAADRTYLHVAIGVGVGIAAVVLGTWALGQTAATAVAAAAAAAP